MNKMISPIVKSLILSILTVFALSHIEHLYQIRYSSDYFNEIGFPLKYQYETTFSDDGLHGFRALNLLLDILLFFIVFLSGQYLLRKKVR